MYRTTGRHVRAMCAIGVLVALATTACSAEPAPAATLRVDRGTVSTTVSASGTLVAISEQNLGFSERGQVKELLVGVGAQVTAGQELARLDDFAVQQTLAQEQATLAQQQAELDRATGGHPFFTPEQNEQFRTVHDVFGHAATGRAFDRHGEEAAWLSHSQMYSPQALRALTTETRGQNAAMLFTGGGEVFQPQKIGLLPEEFSDPRKTSAISRRRGR
jgi:multidrug efflux pump subunit AcrA (membrane-fusion protein)